MPSDVILDNCWTDHDGQSRILDPAAVEKEFTRIHNEAIEQAAKMAEEKHKDFGNDMKNAGVVIADAIRSLKLPDAEK